MPPVSLLLRGGILHDGTGAPPRRADVGIIDERIVHVGRAARAADVIDIGGLAVAPGFIDVHAHSEFTLIADPTAQGKVLQGITTEIDGNCGLSAAPLLGEALAQREGDLREFGISERWESFRDYFALLEERGLALNVATLAGHGNLRASVMGFESRAPTDRQLSRMKGLLKEALNAGAIGLSTGLIYPPGIYSDAGELTALAAWGRQVAGDRFIYASHMRNEGTRLLDALEETVGLARAAGVRAHVSHLKTAGRQNWDKITPALALIREARAAGVTITADRYPYTAASTDLDSLLPEWVFEGGHSAELARLSDGESLGRIKAELARCQPSWDRVCISGVATEGNAWMEGLSLSDVAARLGLAPADALLQVLREEELRVGAVFHSMSEDNLRRILAEPFVMLGTDSAARSAQGPTARGKPHPRGFGSLPRYLSRYAADLAVGIRQVTELPAETFGLVGRGRVAPGYRADLVVFSPEELEDRATYDEPFLPPEGIYHVFVNGRAVVSGGLPTGERPGRVLRHGR